MLASTSGRWGLTLAANLEEGFLAKGLQEVVMQTDEGKAAQKQLLEETITGHTMANFYTAAMVERVQSQRLRAAPKAAAASSTRPKLVELTPSPKKRRVARSDNYLALELNAKVFEKASENAGREIIPFSKMLEQRRVKLAGHVLRSSSTDPMRQISYQPDSASPCIIGRRVGRPRQQWLHNTNVVIYTALTGNDNYMGSEAHTARILQAARNRII